ncbi:MAG: LysR family transcriptional regulator [Psychrobium sp.]|nr:LysR family transcriptional regulator [Psychrobium sp.]
MASFSEYRTFCAIVELKSITAAAKSLHKSASAVSKQLSKLEAGLSVQLIDRSTKALTITPLGEKFYQQCKSILQSVTDSEQALKDEVTTASGKLVLSFPEVLLRTSLMALITKFSQLHKGIQFELRASNTPDNVIDEGIDFAFRIGTLDDSRLTANKLFSARLICIASPKYIERYGKPTSLSQAFDQHKMLLPTYVNLTKTVKELLGISESFSLHQAHLMNSETVIFDAVMQGMGVTALLDFSIQSQLESGELINLLPEQDLPQQNVYFLYHNRDYMPETVRLFKEFIKQEYSENRALSL